MKKEIITSAVVLAAFGVGFLGCVLHPDGEWSFSERRRLAQMPDLSVETLMNGKFMKDFETYTLDQFPLRETFRNIKAQFQYNVLQQKDNNGIYIVDGSLSKIESNLSESSVEKAADKLLSLQEKLFPDSKVFYGVIPDKNYFMAEENGYPHLEYEKLDEILSNKLGSMKRIDLYDCLSMEDYYKTDSHWRQERLEAVAQQIAQSMGVSVTPFEEYTPRSFDAFRGVYWGQSALSVPAEELVYLTSDLLEDCTVYHYETGEETGVYEVENLENPDPYDVFLGGADALSVITNPNAQTGKNLIVFRDSFGSSLIPLLVQDYETVTVVDLRYIASAMLEQFVEFDGQDVLFLYSPAIYNNSTMLK